MAQKYLRIKKINKNLFALPQMISKKYQKNRIMLQINKPSLTLLGDYAYGVKALESAKVTFKQNASLYKILTQKFHKLALFMKHLLLPNWPISQKANGTRMGKGKGPISYLINRLAAAKFSLLITGPHILDGLALLKKTYNSIKKQLNYDTKLIVNTHFYQELYINIQEKLNY
jgi:ribosomal protein L16/L10AE